MEDALKHYGVKGMKWGIRRTPAQLGHKTKSESDEGGSEKAKKPASQSKKLSEMSDEELNKRIKRLDAEKRYRELMASQQQVSKGRKFVERVLERSGENLATQFVTYAGGTAINKAFAGVFNDPAILNPKKGQKD